ncbi:MAG: hypothetical protein WDA75_22940 [Candidatus Latescibacterota bacterium]|jgi:hypothetical protein
MGNGCAECPEHRCFSCFTGYMQPADRAELKKLLGLDTIHQQGVSIPASHAYYREYLDRSAGRKPSVIGTQYWD